MVSKLSFEERNDPFLVRHLQRTIYNPPSFLLVHSIISHLWRLTKLEKKFNPLKISLKKAKEPAPEWKSAKCPFMFGNFGSDTEEEENMFVPEINHKYHLPLISLPFAHFHKHLAMAEDGTVTLNNTTVVTDPKQNPYSFKPGVAQAFRGGAILLVSNPHQAKITEEARAITVSEPSRVRVIHFVELQDSDPRTEIQIQDQDLAQRAVLKRKESVSQGLLEPDPPKASSIVDIVDNLQPDEVVDLEEIERLQGLTVLCDSVPDKSNGNGNQGLSLLKPEFASDFDFDGYGKSKARILEASFRMSFAEFLVESKIVPVHAYGDLENKITGIQHDSRIVSSGGLFVCCVGRKTDESREVQREVEEKDLLELLELFGSAFALVDIMNAYYEAEHDLNLAAETICVSKYDHGSKGARARATSDHVLNPFFHDVVKLESVSKAIICGAVRSKPCAVSLGIISGIVGRGYLNFILSSSTQVHAIEDSLVSSGGFNQNGKFSCGVFMAMVVLMLLKMLVQLFFGRAGIYTKALNVLKEISNNCPVDIVTYNKLVAVYMRTGFLDDEELDAYAHFLTGNYTHDFCVEIVAC